MTTPLLEELTERLRYATRSAQAWSAAADLSDCLVILTDSPQIIQAKIDRLNAQIAELAVHREQTEEANRALAQAIEAIRAASIALKGSDPEAEAAS